MTNYFFLSLHKKIYREMLNEIQQIRITEVGCIIINARANILPLQYLRSVAASLGWRPLCNWSCVVRIKAFMFSMIVNFDYAIKFRIATLSFSSCETDD